MSFILYCGPEEIVKKQLNCKHVWHGPCIDDIARYNACVKCFCIEYDCTWEQYRKRDEEAANEKEGT